MAGDTITTSEAITSWSFEAASSVGEGWYYVSDGNGHYLNLSANPASLTLTSTPQPIYVATRTVNGNTEYQLRTQENGGVAVNNYAHTAGNGFSTWKAGNGNNEWFRFYTVEYLGEVRVTFNQNGGTTDAPDPMYGIAGNTITLPDYTGTREGYTFIGWSTTNNVGQNSYYPVYPAGSQYTVPDLNVTLYAVWTSNTPATAEFYIRLDGTIPYEPDQYNSSAYTGKITIAEAIKKQMWVTDNDTTKPDNGVNIINDVTDNLNQVPSVDQLVSNINGSYKKLGFKVANQNGEIVVTEITDAGINSQNYNVSVGDALYVLWYVQKYAGGWHVDGALLVKNRVKISYNGNTSDGSAKNIPLGYQAAAGTEVTIGASGSANGTVKTPTRTGYNFLGWNLNPDGSGTWYSNNDIYTLNEDTTLYAQWSKGTNLMTVSKTNEEGVVLAGAVFKLEEKTAAGNYIEKAVRTTGETGMFSYDTLENDTLYRMTETYAPNGYEVRDSFFFKVAADSTDSSVLALHLCDEDGNYLSGAQKPDWLTISYTPSDDPSAIGVARIQFIITDKIIPKNVVLKKIGYNNTDNSSWDLAGASFKIYSDEQKQNPVTLNDKTEFTSGEDGLLYEGELEGGTYYLDETVVPAGYNGPSGMYVLTVTEEGITLNSTATIGSSDLNSWITHSTDETGKTVYTVSLRNVTGVTLPSTGGTGPKWFYIAGIALLTCTGGLLWLKCRRKTDNRSGRSF